MEVQQMSREDVARKAREIYESVIRAQVENDEAIGKMIVIDVETGAYALDDEKSPAASVHLRSLNPNARLFGLRIGYRTAYSLGGVMERTP